MAADISLGVGSLTMVPIAQWNRVEVTANSPLAANVVDLGWSKNLVLLQAYAASQLCDLIHPIAFVFSWSVTFQSISTSKQHNSMSPISRISARNSRWMTPMSILLSWFSSKYVSPLISMLILSFDLWVGRFFTSRRPSFPSECLPELFAMF